ncbi:MAG: response regulator [Leptospirales bacterium]|nr:response regulator [Leptospirales bacterium]
MRTERLLVALFVLKSLSRKSPGSGIVVLTLAMSLLLACSSERKAAPVAVAGTMDLRNWNFQKDGPVLLNGEWDFYWRTFLEKDAPDGHRSAMPARVPGSWHELSDENGQLPVYGYASYRLKILLQPGDPELSIITGQMGTACSLAVDGRTVWEGGYPGKTKSESFASYRPALVSVPTHSEQLELTLRCSNFDHALKAGFWNPLEIGKPHTMAEKWEAMIRLDWFAMGSLLIMGLYHLGLYSLRRKDRSALWFGLFCLLIALRSISVGTYYVSRSLPIEWFWLAAKLDFLSFYIATPVILLFLSNIFPEEVKGRFVTIICIVSSLASVFVVFTPQSWYTATLTAFEILIVVTGIYCAAQLILAVVRGRQGGRLFFAGFIVFFATIVNDILVQQMFVVGPQVSAYGLFFFVLCQAFLLSRRFADAFVKVEELSSDLELRNIKLQTLDKAKDEFLANTSHELRTPLHGIIGLAETLLDGEKLPADLRRTVTMIASSGKRLASLVNDILDFQKLRHKEIALQLQPLDVRDIVEIVLAVCAPLTRGKDLKLINEIPEGLPAVIADENRLQQILHNIIGNAIKFTPSGSVRVTASSQSNMVAISILDTGIGIPLDKQESIFESFEQADASTEREFGGTGLGLSITRHLVELHGGNISVESSPGQGSNFTVKLPLSAEPGKRTDGASLMRTHVIDPDTAEAPSGFNVKPEPGSSLRVLIVDDEAINREVLAGTLGARNYLVKQASDGPMALDLLKQDVPDAVLLDVMMPRMNGYEVCRIIREQFSPSELPVVFLSAKNRVEDLVAGFAAGGNDYLPKPFSIPELLARVKTQTNLKMAHADAKTLRQKLLQQEQLATIGNMAAGIVHDLKNPMGIIKGSVELADDSNIGAAERRKLLHIIDQESDRMILLVQDLLNYSQGAVSVNRQPVNLTEYAERIRTVLSPGMQRKKIRFTLNVADQLHAMIDGERFLRVLVNIANNAADAMSEGGEFTVNISQSGGKIVFTLRDNGPGIPESIRDTLFEPFVTYGKAHGTGLGMAIAKSMVEAHNGSISFETVTGKGTAFTIELPA